MIHTLQGLESDGDAPTSRYHNQDIVLHEFAHGLQIVGLDQALSGFARKLKDLHKNIPKAWKNAYARTNHNEYFVSGVSGRPIALHNI